MMVCHLSILFNLYAFTIKSSVLEMMIENKSYFSMSSCERRYILQVPIYLHFGFSNIKVVRQAYG